MLVIKTSSLDIFVGIELRTSALFKYRVGLGRSASGFYFFCPFVDPVAAKLSLLKLTRIRNISYLIIHSLIIIHVDDIRRPSLYRSLYRRHVQFVPCVSVHRVETLIHHVHLWLQIHRFCFLWFILGLF